MGVDVGCLADVLADVGDLGLVGMVADLFVAQVDWWN